MKFILRFTYKNFKFFVRLLTFLELFSKMGDRPFDYTSADALQLPTRIFLNQILIQLGKSV